MADHLPLPRGRTLGSRRERGNPQPEAPVKRPEHSENLRGQLREIDPYLEGPSPEEVDEDAPETRLVLKLSGTTRLEAGPLNGLNLTQLGEGAGWTYAVMSTRGARRLLSDLLAQYAPTEVGDIWERPKNWAKLFDHLEGVEVYGPEDRFDPELAELSFEQPEVLDILIWPSQSRAASDQRIATVRAAVEQAIGTADVASVERVVSVDPRPQTTMLRARLLRETLERLLEEPWIERIRPPLRPRLTQAQVAQTEVTRTLPQPEGAPIGVVDGVVVSDHPVLADRVLEARTFPDGYAFAGADSHGTRVASIASWGNLFFLPDGAPAPVSSPLICARVFDTRPDGELEVAGEAHKTVEQAVRWLVEEHAVRVVTMSVNRRYPRQSLLPSDLCYTIDWLSRELGVVFVLSSGNRESIPEGGWFDRYPEYLADADAGIADPGDAALAITVGALSLRDVPGSRVRERELAVAPAGSPAPFTRCGPVKGRTWQGMLKPEFVADGGNFVSHADYPTYRDDDPGVAVLTAIPSDRGGRALGFSSGTSFSAPAVAHEVAMLASRYPTADANLLRALTALSSRRAGHREFGAIDKFRVSAYGTPEAANVLESDGPHAILTIQAQMATNSTVVHRLPVPYEFARGGTRRTLRVALAYDPPVRRGRREYIAGHMTVELVRRLSFEDVDAIYSKQPTKKERDANPELVKLKLPDGALRPSLEPGVTRLESNTLVKREFVDGSWDPDDENYFLVVTHNPSPWGVSARRSYQEQNYAIAVELLDEERADLDVHNLVRAEIVRLEQEQRLRLR